MMIHLSFLFILAFFAIERVQASSLYKTDSVQTQITSKNNPDISMRFVTNSGVCETTPGVQQISGYVDVGKNMSMVSISFLVKKTVTDLRFSGSGSLSHEILRKRLLSHFGMSCSLFCGDSGNDIR